MLTCIIRYQIDPTKKSQFEQYARNWGQAIPRCGADLVGYYAPVRDQLRWLMESIILIVSLNMNDIVRACYKTR